MPRSKQFDESQVLQKSIDLFWEKGYHATSIQNLVDHLGINRASLYDTFGGKEALFEKALSAYRKEGKTRLAQIFEDSSDLKSSLKELLVLSLKAVMADPQRKGCFVVNCTTEFTQDDHKILKSLADNKADFETFFSEIIRSAQASGVIQTKEEPEILGRYIFTIYNGIQVLGKIEDNEKEALRMIDFIFERL